MNWFYLTKRICHGRIRYGVGAMRKCPRCLTNGLYLDKDMYGVYLICLHCGYVKDVEPERKHRELLDGFRENAEKTGRPTRISGNGH